MLEQRESRNIEISNKEYKVKVNINEIGTNSLDMLTKFHDLRHDDELTNEQKLKKLEKILADQGF